jgi:hypothetical protein
VLQRYHEDRGEELLLLAPCPGVKTLAGAQDLKTQAPELYEEWEEAGLLAPADILAGLKELGYHCTQGSRVGVGADQGEQGSSSSSSSSWVSVPVDITLEVPDKPEEKVAVVVSFRGTRGHLGSLGVSMYVFMWIPCLCLCLS